MIPAARFIRALALALAAFFLLPQGAAAQSSVSVSQLFDSPIAASVTDATGVTTVASGSRLFVISGSGTVLSTRTITGMTFRALAVDGSGNLYGTGDFTCAGGGCVPPPTVFTTGAVPSVPAGPAVIKLNADGSLGYLDVFVVPGANPTDSVITGITVDIAGGAYVTGVASCGWQTTAGALRTACTPGTRLGFVSKIAASGQSLAYSTFLDGALGGTAPAGVAVDTTFNAYVTGSTTAPDFPTTAGAFAAATTAASNGFVAKLNPAGSALTYSTFFPNGLGAAIAVDTAGAAYIAGTSTGGLPVTPGVISGSFTPDAAGAAAHFAAKLNPAGSALAYATYLAIAQQAPAPTAATCPASPAQAGSFLYLSCRISIVLDVAGDAFVAGTTTHAGGPAVNAVQNVLGDRNLSGLAGDGYIAAVNSSATNYLLSTYLGGRDGDAITGLGRSSDGTITAGGMTFVNQFPVIVQVGSSVASTSGFLTRVATTGTAVPILFPADRPPFGVAENLGELEFGTAQQGQTLTKKIHLGNYGGSALTVAGFTTTGEFTQTNACPATLNPGDGCDITVTFAPTFAGPRSGTLSVQTNATGGVQTNRLTATAQGPSVLLSTHSLTFGVVALGSTSAPLTVTITNTGTSQLQVGAVSTTAQFGATSQCTTAIQPQSSCTVTVTFTPTASGEVDGTLTINDNAFGSPQTVSLIGGITPDFALAVASTSNATQTVAAGATASYTLTETPSGGFNGTIAFTCSGAPTGATCTITPASVTVNSAAVTTLGVTVTTTARAGTVPLVSSGFANTPLWLALFALSMVWIARRRRQMVFLIKPLFLVALFALLLTPGCGGKKSTTTTTTTGTPAATSTLTITGTAGSTTHTLSLTLTVT